MADEPLYCEICGIEWGQPGCPHGFDEQHGRQPPPAREERFCHFCGVIPQKGLECPYYDPPGRNKGGCNHIIDRTPGVVEEGMSVFRIRISGHTDWGGCVVHVDVVAFDEVTAIKDVLADLARDAPPEDLVQLKFETVPVEVP